MIEIRSNQGRNLKELNQVESPGPVQLLTKDSSIQFLHVRMPSALNTFSKLTSRFVGSTCLYARVPIRFPWLLQRHLHQQRVSDDTRADACGPCIICALIADLGVLLSSLLPFSSVLFSAHASKRSSRARTTTMATKLCIDDLLTCPHVPDHVPPRPAHK